MANVMKEDSMISSFYRGKSIFITGATGFIGKTLIEKLLRSCDDLDKIYILIRAKKGRSLTERLDEILNSKLFDHVKKLNPDFREKVIPIQGDLQEPNLGISTSDRNLLINNVNVVFHSAATVRFDEPLKVAVQINIIGTKKIIQLCKELTNLKAFIHISTAYANCDRTEIREEIYKSPIEPKKLVNLIDLIDDNLTNYISPIVIKPKPNTYTYSKALTETLIMQECKDMPCVIVRPSIVGASWREPYRGWVDGINGMNALYLAFGTGFLKNMLADRNVTADVIPVDIVVNTLLSVGWFIGTAEKQTSIPVFNCTSGQLNRLTWGMIQEHGKKILYKVNSDNRVFLPNIYFTKSRLVRDVRTLIEQIIPSHIMDLVLRLFNKKPMLVKIQSKIKKAIGCLEYFTMNEWKFDNQNLLRLMNKVEGEDSQEFNFDVKNVNWEEYFENYAIGTKVFILNEDLDKMDTCIKKMFRLKATKTLLMFWSFGYLTYRVLN